MARKLSPSKRANRRNPREDRNLPDNQLPDFIRKGRNAENEPKAKRVEIIPRSVSQEIYLDALEDDRKHIVLATGCAGTGKTLLATLYAIKGLQEGKYRKIVITRPAVSVDESHGFLPGNLLEKLAPWLIPVMDVFKEHYSVPALKKLIENEVIEPAALAYMRGRSIKNSIIILDEAQNALPTQMKMMMTRIGEGSKLIITGDLGQHDRGFETNGLGDFIRRLEATGSVSIALCRFSEADVERHPVIEEVLRLYGDDAA